MKAWLGQALAILGLALMAAGWIWYMYNAMSAAGWKNVKAALVGDPAFATIFVGLLLAIISLLLP